MDSMTSGFYWAHCTGPDGPVVLLVRFNSWNNIFTLIEDGDREVHGEADKIFSKHGWSTEEVYFHKWKVLWIQPVTKPPFDGWK